MILLALQGQHIVLGLALLLLGHLQFVFRLLQLPLRRLRLLRGLVEPVVQGALRAGEPFQLVGAGQHAGGAADGAAGHGAAPVDDLPVQRDDAEGAAELPGKGDAAVQILHHHRATQQIPENVIVPAVVAHQPAGHAHKAVFAVYVLPQLVAADGRQRQEGGAPAVPLLQELDGRLCVLLPVHHDVLQRAAQRRLQRHGILLLRGHQAGHGAVDAAQRVLLRRLHDGLDRLVEALVLLLHLGQQPDAVILRAHLHGQLQFGRLCRFRLLAAAVHAQAVSLDDILHRLRFLLGIVQRPAVLFGFLLAALQLGLCVSQLLPHGCAALIGALQRRVQGGQRGAPVGGLRHGDGLLRPQGLGLVRRAPGTVGQCLRLCQQRVQLPAQFSGRAVDIRNMRQLRVDLPLQILPPRVGVGQLLLQPAQGVVVVVDGRLQHGDGRGFLPGGAVGFAGLLPQRLRLYVVLAHLLGEALAQRVGLVQRLLRPVALRLGQRRVGFQLQPRRAQILQLLQPHGDLQHTQLVAEHQILLRRLRLLAQRLYLQFKLRDLVVDAHQILLRALQLPLGVLFPVAVFADTGGLLKDLAALAALDGQDLVDLALPDDGVALAPHAGVHEQLVHVLQAHGLLVDVVFRLAAAVVAPRHRHLRLLTGGENVLRVVDDQRHLGKAHLVPLLRAAEDHVLHLGAAQLAAVLLAHDPADGVGDVGLAGAVGPHDSGDILAEVQNRLIGKALESLNFQRF